ncbi:MAG: hypothetical protein WCW02_00140 [Candidatus Buchananbacteria bacterium]
MIKNSEIKIGLYRRLAISFISLTVILLVAVIYFSLAKAEIQIVPLAQSSNVDFVINIQNQASGEETLAGQLVEASLAAEKVFPVIATKEIKTNILGEVTLTNTTNNPQTLVATTRLLSPDQVLLRLNKKVLVPAKGQVSVEVYADKPEAFSTLAPTKFTIPGLRQDLQSQIYAESANQLTSGFRQIKILTQVEIDRIRGEYTKELTKQIISQLNSKIGGQLAEDQVKVEIKDFSVSDPVETETDETTVKLALHAVAVTYDQNKMLELAQTKLLGYLPQAKELAGLSGSQLTVAIQDYDLAKQQAKLRVSYQTNFWLQPGSGILDKSQLVGLSTEQVKQYFTQFSEIKEIKIKLSPPWSTYLPKEESKIEIKIISQ